MKRIFLAIVVALAATSAVTACTPSPQQIELSADTMIIDVRTPQEFAEGHLEGAVNIDVNSPVFLETISTLPTTGDYFVYCRSGNRSGQAIEQMTELGFTSLTNGGSVQEASDMTGIPVIP